MDFSTWSDDEIVRILNSWIIVHATPAHFNWHNNEEQIEKIRHEAIKRESIRAVPVKDVMEGTKFHCIEGNYDLRLHFDNGRHCAIGGWGAAAFIDWEYNGKIQYMYFD